MAKKPDPRVTEHIHNDFEVTPERVRSFGKSDRATRLLVLAELRKRANDDWNSTELTLIGLMFGVAAVILAPKVGLDVGAHPAWALAVVGLVVGFAAVVAFLPIILPAMATHNRRKIAHVWLGAFQDEIERRRTSRTKS